MSMLRRCAAPGCGVLTLGGLCLEHEAPVVRADWPRGRPFPTLASTAVQRPTAGHLAMRSTTAGSIDRIRPPVGPASSTAQRSGDASRDGSPAPAATQARATGIVPAR